MRNVQSICSSEDSNELGAVTKLFQNPRFQHALRVHNKIVEVLLKTPKLSPEEPRVQTLSKDVLNLLNSGSSRFGAPTSLLADALKGLLNNVHVKVNFRPCINKFCFLSPAARISGGREEIYFSVQG